MLRMVILEKPPSEIKLIVSRNFDQGLWGITQILEQLHQELNAKESCLESTQDQSTSSKYETSKYEQLESFGDKYTGSFLLAKSRLKSKSGKSCFF